VSFGLKMFGDGTDYSCLRLLLKTRQLNILIIGMRSELKSLNNHAPHCAMFISAFTMDRMEYNILDDQAILTAFDKLHKTIKHR
jgi:hypothetical protein